MAYRISSQPHITKLYGIFSFLLFVFEVDQTLISRCNFLFLQSQ